MEIRTIGFVIIANHVNLAKEGGNIQANCSTYKGRNGTVKSVQLRRTGQYTKCVQYDFKCSSAVKYPLPSIQMCPIVSNISFSVKKLKANFFKFLYLLDKKTFTHIPNPT